MCLKKRQTGLCFFFGLCSDHSVTHYDISNWNCRLLFTFWAQQFTHDSLTDKAEQWSIMGHFWLFAEGTQTNKQKNQKWIRLQIMDTQLLHQKLPSSVPTSSWSMGFMDQLETSIERQLGDWTGSYGKSGCCFQLWTQTHTHKTHNCRDNYLPDEDGKQARPKWEVKEGGGVQLPDPPSYQRQNVIHRQPPRLNW